MKVCSFLNAIAINPVFIKYMRWMILLLSVWAILSIQFSVVPRICVVWNYETVRSFNSMYLTLAYSYIAAYFFYLLTNRFPIIERQTKLSPIIKRNIKDVGRDIRNILLEFARDTEFNYNYDTPDAGAILMSKEWLSNIPKFQTYHHVSITYLAFINAEGNAIKEKIESIIGKYKDELTVDQLVALEKIKDSMFFRRTKFLCSLDLGSIGPGGYRDLVALFCEMQKQYLEIVSKFDIDIE